MKVSWVTRSPRWFTSEDGPPMAGVPVAVTAPGGDWPSHSVLSQPTAIPVATKIATATRIHAVQRMIRRMDMPSPQRCWCALTEAGAVAKVESRRAHAPHRTDVITLTVFRLAG